MYKRRLILLFSLILICIAITACGGRNNGDATEEVPTIDPATLPTAVPDFTPTPVPDAGVGEGGSIPGSSAFEAEGELTTNELDAQAAGEAVYSGYTCVISPEGCACEEPIVERITFTFEEDNILRYNFKGDGYSSEWEMTRLAPNQWSYTLPIYNNSGNFTGAFTVLMTLNSSGFEYNLGADYGQDGFVSCPTINFRRVNQ